MVGSLTLWGTTLSERGRLIIVDDEPIILNLLANVFRDEPFEIVACPDGTSALEAFADGVDVLLTDKNLPDIGGLELLQHARRHQPDCEVILITGYASLDTALAAMQLAAFDYIVKPPKDIFDVRRKVRQAFDKLHMGRENRRLLAHLEQRNAELEEALRRLGELQAELVQSEKLAGIGTLAAGVAHEISSPLFGIMGLAEAIGDEEDRELAKGYAAEIVEYSRNIRDIVTQLTDYARTAHREECAPVDIGRVVDDAVKLVVRSLPFDPSRVHVSIDEGLRVRARSNELQQVFVNLVKNAVEAVLDHPEADRGGAVRVQGGLQDGVVEVRVCDEGGGIAEEHVRAVFDPFFTTKPPGQGTGLGLNIAYRILQRYGGTLSVESEPGRGSRFLVRIPSVEA